MTLTNTDGLNGYSSDPIETYYEGWTALTIALMLSNESIFSNIAKLLLDHGAHPNIRDVNGRTCIFYTQPAGISLLTTTTHIDYRVTDNYGKQAYQHMNNPKARKILKILTKSIIPKDL